MDTLENAEVIDRQQLNEELAIIKVRPDSGAAPLFEPGQYAELSVLDNSPKIIRRAYSIASSPLERGHLEFYFVLVPDGAISPKLWELKVGERLWLGPKVKGKFTLEELPQGKDLVMVATGTGIAPYISMLRTFRGKNRWERFVLIHGVRKAHDLGYHKELETICKEDNTVFYIPTVTRDETNTSWSGLRGRIQSVFEGTMYQKIVGVPLSPDRSNVFLCGNPQMIDSTEELLKSRGFTPHSKKHPGNIHIERYW